MRDFKTQCEYYSYVVRRTANLFVGLLLLFTLIILSFTNELYACSTFKLQKGDSLVYGHNLNEADIGVPGLIFINKRGIFKTRGGTLLEIQAKFEEGEMIASVLVMEDRFGTYSLKKKDGSN